MTIFDSQLPTWTNEESSAKVKGFLHFTAVLTVVTSISMRDGGNENMPEDMDVVQHTVYVHAKVYTVEPAYSDHFGFVTMLEFLILIFTKSRCNNSW